MRGGGGEGVEGKNVFLNHVYPVKAQSSERLTRTCSHSFAKT